MKSTTILSSVLTVGLLAVWLVTPVTAKDKPKATVSKAAAKKIALAKVPGGKIKDAELEKEGGKLFWSFDIATKGTKDITEVHVDAKTGEVLWVEKESAADEAAERAKEKKEGVGKKEKKEKDDDEKDEKQ